MAQGRVGIFTRLYPENNLRRVRRLRTGRSADNREKRSQKRRRDAETKRQQGEARTKERSAVKRDNRDEETRETTGRSADNRDNRDAETTGRGADKREKNMMPDFVFVPLVSLVSLPSLRHCESRKARGNLILSALTRRSPRSLMLARDDGQSALLSPYPLTRSAMSPPVPGAVRLMKSDTT